MALPFHKLLASIGGGNAGLSAIAKYGASLWLPGVTAYEDNHVASDGSGGLAVANDYIGYAKDINSSKNAIQATTGFKPQLKQSGSVYYWQGDAVDDAFEITAVSPVSGGAVDGFFSIAFRMHLTTVPASKYLITTSNGTADQLLVYTAANERRVRAYCRNSAGSTAAAINSDIRANNELLIATLYLQSSTLFLRVRGSINPLSTASVAVTNGINAFSKMAFIAGYVGPSTLGAFWPERVFGAVAGNGTPTADEFSAIENTLAAKAGFSLV